MTHALHGRTWVPAPAPDDDEGPDGTGLTLWESEPPWIEDDEERIRAYRARTGGNGDLPKREMT